MQRATRKGPPSGPCRCGARLGVRENHVGDCPPPVKCVCGVQWKSGLKGPCSTPEPARGAGAPGVAHPRVAALRQASGPVHLLDPLTPVDSSLASPGPAPFCPTFPRDLSNTQLLIL